MTQSLTKSYSRQLFDKGPNDALEIAVIIPVKNEEEGLNRTLEALRMQVDEFGMPLENGTYEILLLANNCTDDSAALARAYQSAYPDFRLHVAEVDLDKEEAHVGTVRRLLMDEAYDRLMSIGRPRGIIVSTDGDTEVDLHWLYYIMAEMKKGNDVVGGRILPKDTPALSKMHHLRDVSYRFHLSRLESILDPCIADPWPRHFQCYGPSLAVTCSIYDKAGRIPIIPYLEDEEFRKALYRVDARVRKSPKVKVYTSSRLIGKVEFGFSIQLQQWGDMTLANQQQHVEPLISLIHKIRLKNDLRQLWNQRTNAAEYISQLKFISHELLVDAQWLSDHFKTCQYFGELWELVDHALNEGSWREANTLKPITEVIGHFRHYFASNQIAS